MDERKLIYADDAIEAIDEITWYHQNINNEMVRGANSSEDQAWYKAEDVYEALEQLPSAQPEHTETHSCDCECTETHDLVSREAAIDAVKQHMNNVSGGNDEYYIAHRHIIELLQIVPTAEPESHREWYMHGYRDAQNAAMHESCTDCPLYDHDRHNCPRFNKVIPATIEEVTPRWIPVSEALPRDDEEVIVTCLDDSGDTPFSYTTVAWHYKGMWVCENERCPFVVAWMPLPEPWRGEQDGTRD